ncbi:MAG TPA: hypothetical protein QGF02_01015 [Candidatus Babeliales bacterium]|nr:hypothetical protein [Candidatus Babeliales bacterium]
MKRIILIPVALIALLSINHAAAMESASAASDETLDASTLASIQRMINGLQRQLRADLIVLQQDIRTNGTKQETTHRILREIRANTEDLAESINHFRSVTLERLREGR